ncbi:MAG: hypothetical protein EZS28_003529 [Streblomastix strix]|uniref:Uncharacterized protein n=1 Tax=Streblomastix strix TaxID=222440 RepID=A0A5J4X2N2_9EUKA|nr:MAG: hypothetical protein EZS28_003529 [Streblomastix strix]
MNEIILSQIGKSELGQQINDSSNVLLELIRILSNQTSITPIPQSKPKSPDPQPSNQNQYYSSIPKPQSKSPASSPPIQSTSLSQSNSKGKIVIAPPPQPKNINQSQKPQAPSSINVNLNVGNEDIEQVKVYAIYILDKLKKGEVLEQKHFTWIFKLCPDKAAEFNQKNQNEKIILLGGILNAIIQKTGGQ